MCIRGNDEESRIDNHAVNWIIVSSKIVVGWRRNGKGLAFVSGLRRVRGPK